jgi:hypothetical protein
MVKLPNQSTCLKKRPKKIPALFPARRIEHWVFMASFTIPGYHRLGQKFATSYLRCDVVGLGGIENVRWIHMPRLS